MTHLERSAGSLQRCCRVVLCNNGKSRGAFRERYLLYVCMYVTMFETITITIPTRMTIGVGGQSVVVRARDAAGGEYSIRFIAVVPMQWQPVLVGDRWSRFGVLPTMTGTYGVTVCIAASSLQHCQGRPIREL